MDKDMSQNDVERFLGRLITDATFRARAQQALETACHSEGFVLSQTELSLLHQLDYSLIASFAASIDDSIKRS